MEEAAKSSGFPKWLVVCWFLFVFCFVTSMTMVVFQRNSGAIVPSYRSAMYIERLGWAMATFFIVALIGSFRYLKSKGRFILLGIIIVVIGLLIFSYQRLQNAKEHKRVAQEQKLQDFNRRLQAANERAKRGEPGASAELDKLMQEYYGNSAGDPLLNIPRDLGQPHP